MHKELHKLIERPKYIYLIQINLTINTKVLAYS